MLHIVTDRNMHDYQDEMDQAFRLRHRVFVDERGWNDLTRADGRETDQFDTADAVHMLFINEGEVLGYQRMLPSTKPHLLSEVLPQLCEQERPIGRHIWEWTRYCVEPAYREHGRALSAVSNALLSGFVEWGLENDINTVIIEMQPLWILRLLQLHFRVSALGLPQSISGEDVVAVTASFDERTLTKLRSLKTDLRRRAA
ncbi:MULTISPECIES: acyl-homoserine-lactone synthase [Rhizobium]|uniref:Acyl-homoserine-lactone synthase n=1 Tax=Rhizobium tropici TaxID=398 RepID=A0A329Y2K3_RHITR|nr:MULTISPECIES: acyl-homoserine-lactone synthase [Rhizobium]MBB3285135.1 acyl-homoserine lactone synthase [Rhizobium sp. BK252]MBB3399874.1 acyl-homoserine lactone synthase [Rhizobium sp. BK289]MBB3412454.1 acyl-homoserine lactone synthase [Rhizobium sp. BK284]MBB3480340.1 acyl-homoserine lactone synthase [Rhizobium sp. BK347]RAX38051.1 autoinducer synthase [Rhizobium tropici]